MDDATRLSTLHGHYQDTFASIRERERERDRVFVVLILTFALLSIQVAYPMQSGGVADQLAFGGLIVRVGALPAAALLSATWVLVSVIALRYCQRVVWVETQYHYLHRLEGHLAKMLGEKALFEREGKAYLEGAPLFQDWAWIFYVLLLPLIGTFAGVALLILELGRLEYPVVHKAIDTVVASTLIVSLYLYRLHPPRENIRRLGHALRPK